MKIKFLNKEKKESPNDNRNGNNNNYRKVQPEPLRKIYENQKMFLRKTMELIEVSVQDQLTVMFADYTTWRKGKSKRPEYIFNMIQDIAFVSVLPKIVKKNAEIIETHGEELSEIIAAAISELSRSRVAKSKEMIAVYSKIYEDLNEERIKKIFKLDLNGVDWDGALKLSIASHGSPRHTMNNVLRFIYNNVKCRDYDELYKLLKKLYGKEDMDKVAVYITLEKAYDRAKTSWIDKEQYSVLTNIALDEINQRTKEEIKDLLKLYCSERRRTEFEEFTRRRVNFAAINKDDYGKIDSVVKKLVKKNELYRVFLDHSNLEKPKK